MRTTSICLPDLQVRLDSLYRGFNAPASQTDPIELVRPYQSGPDREVAGFIAAGLAFGNVVAVMASVRAVLERMGPRPDSTGSCIAGPAIVTSSRYCTSYGR